MKRNAWLGAWLLLFFGTVSVVAQVTTGTISGTVSDSTGAVMAGAKIVVQNEDTGMTRTATSDSSGRYQRPLCLWATTASPPAWKVSRRKFAAASC